MMKIKVEKKTDLIEIGTECVFMNDHLIVKE